MKNLGNSDMYKSAIPILKDKDGEFSEQPAVKKVRGGFAKVVAGGRIVRLQNEKPFIERMVTGNRPNTHSHLPPDSMAVLESIKANLKAGIELVDAQETALAKIGGRLSEIALTLNHVQSPRSSMDVKISSQKDLRSVGIQFVHLHFRLTMALPSFHTVKSKADNACSPI